MTLVVKIAKLIIVEQLEKKVSDSRERDTKKSIFSYIAPPRNLDLSSKKQNILTQLITEIKAFLENSSIDDKTQIINMMTVLQTAKQVTMSESTKVNQSRGSTERLLEHLCAFTHEFYNFAEAFKFKDKPADVDIYTLFVEACALYFARRILDKGNTTLFKDVMENQYITPHNEFYQHLDQLVNQRMFYAWQMMQALKPKDTNILATQAAISVNCIDMLLLEHKQLREKYSLTLGQFYLQNNLDEYLIKARQSTSYEPGRFDAPVLDQDLSAALLTNPEKSTKMNV